MKRQLDNTSKAGKNVKDMLQPTMLHTFIHKDNHIEHTVCMVHSVFILYLVIYSVLL